MTFDEWWDTTKAAATPETFAGWEQSCRQAWNAATAATSKRCASQCELVADKYDGRSGPQAIVAQVCAVVIRGHVGGRENEATKGGV
jgi:hypothetical protein